MDAEDDTGLCHICKEIKRISYCELCGHWTCPDCRGRYWQRGLAAVKEMLGGHTPGCCGPEEQEKTNG
jgi:hypothetical protein